MASSKPDDADIPLLALKSDHWGRNGLSSLRPTKSFQIPFGIDESSHLSEKIAGA
jgi:hypothetical protein